MFFNKATQFLIGHIILHVVLLVSLRDNAEDNLKFFV